jgi:hypothetical protein
MRSAARSFRFVAQQFQHPLARLGLQCLPDQPSGLAAVGFGNPRLDFGDGYGAHTQFAETQAD